MKKIALLLAVILLGTASFAATAGKVGYGVQGLTVTSGNITMPTVQYYFNDGMAGELGLAFATRSAAGASVTNFTLALAIKNALGKAVSGIQPQWGVGLAYTSNPAMAANTSNLLLALNVGAKYFITPNFSLEGNLIPLAINSFTAAGATTTTFAILNSASGLPAATIGAHIYL